MEFENWREWSGSEVAFFIATFCDLPQYSDAIEQNFTGPSLDRLFAASMLRKGLARAGVCDFEHQRMIAEAIGRLDYEEPENLGRELEERVREGRGVLQQNRPRRPPPNSQCHGPPGRRIRIDMRVGKDFDPGPWIRSSPRPPDTETATMLRRPCSPGGHSSKVRHTPRPFVKAPPGMPPSARGLHGRRVAYGVLEYEAMRDARPSINGGDQMPLGVPLSQEKIDANSRLAALVPKAPSAPRPPGQPRPPPVTLMGFTSKSDDFIDPSNPANSTAASVIQRRWRDKQQNAMPSQKKQTQQEAREEESAATRIQSSFRGRKAREEVRMIKHGGGADAAVAGLRGVQQIAAQRHMHHEKSEVGKQPQKMLDTVIHALGHDGPESSEEIRKMELSATKIQANHRRRAAQAEVDELRAKQRDVQERRDRGEVEPLLQPEGHHSHRKMSEEELAAEEQKAALRIQSSFRGRKAREEVKIHRHGWKTVEHPSDPELEHSAVKIQAVHRGRQQRKLDQERRHKQEETQAATKIQAIHRGNQQRKGKGHHDQEQRHKQEEAQAATKIQAIHRGNQQRKGDLEQRHQREETQAATKIQAIHRGNQQRKGSSKG